MQAIETCPSEITQQKNLENCHSKVLKIESTLRSMAFFQFSSATPTELVKTSF